MLRAKCRFCQHKISLQYPIIELAFSLMLLHIYMHFCAQGCRWVLVGYYGFFAGCILTASIIDLKHYIIPDEINLAGIIAGIVGAALFPEISGNPTMFKGILHSVLGIGVGFISLRIVVSLGSLLFHREAMGLGDPKFLAMIGAFLGWKLSLLVIFISSLMGTAVGGSFILFFRKNKKDTVIPYGPFLALGAYVSLFYGNRLIQWYLNLFTFNY